MSVYLALAICDRLGETVEANVINRFVWGDHSNDSWPAAAVAIAGYGVGFGIAMRFFAAWRRRQERVSQEADDALDARDPML